LVEATVVQVTEIASAAQEMSAAARTVTDGMLSVSAIAQVAQEQSAAIS
jgi:hypothetical protein